MIKKHVKSNTSIHRRQVLMLLYLLSMDMMFFNISLFSSPFQESRDPRRGNETRIQARKGGTKVMAPKTHAKHTHDQMTTSKSNINTTVLQ